MELFIKIYIWAGIFAGIAVAWDTYRFICTDYQAHCRYRLTIPTWIVGTIFCASVWPLVIIYYIVGYFLALSEER